MVTSPADIEFALPPQASLTPNEYVLQLRKELRAAHETARRQLQERCVRNKRNYDINILQKQYNAGDAVYVLVRTPTMGVPKKLKPVYKGPALVTKRISSYTYKIRHRDRVFYVNHEDLKPCRGSVPKWLERARRPERIDDPQRDRILGPYCVCRKKYDGTFMIACDYCNEWYHGSCVGVPEAPSNKLPSYKCEACAEEKEEFKMTAAERKERNQSLNDQDQDNPNSSSDSDN